MTSVGSVALAVLLARFLLAGTAADLGPSVQLVAPALLAAGVAWGLMSRFRLPYMAHSVLLVLLVPARGPLCDAVLSLLPDGLGAPHVAAAVSLVPVAFMLGRHLGPCDRHEGLLGAALGWSAAEFLVLLGAVGWLPGPLTGFVVAGLLAVMGELGRPNRGEAQGPVSHSPGWEGLPLGMALALLVDAVARVVPSYAEPSVQASSAVVLALLLPATLVALPSCWLARGAGARRALFVLGSLGLGLAIWAGTSSLGVYAHGSQLMGMTRSLRNLANDWVLLDEWHAWLLQVLAYAAAAAGVLLGSLRRRVGGPLLLGLALGLLVSQRVLWSPTSAPQEQILLAAGVVAAGSALVFSRWGALLLPAAVLPLLLQPADERLGFEYMRRLGDYSADAWNRNLLTDVALFSTGDLGNISVDGRRAARFSFTGRKPYLLLDAEVAPPESLSHPDPSHASADAVHLGLRIGGVPMSPDHQPTGAEGSVGRLLRVFAQPGPALVLGAGAELLAADLDDAGFGPPLLVSTPTPLGGVALVELLSALGSDGVSIEVGEDPVRDLAAQQPGVAALVLLAPERVAWPLAGWALTRSNLVRLAERLAPGGRCLAWIDTQGLDARALRARLAAFGEVFGTRSLALVEPRELSPPLVLLVGWRDEVGAPGAEELAARLPSPDRTGWRTRLQSLDDLGALLLADGPRLEALAAAGPVHDRSRPVPASVAGAHGWAAVEALLDPASRLSASLPGAPAAGPISARVVEGLALHEGLFYELERLRDVMMVEIIPDVDWDLFEQEVAAYERAASADADDPLLMLAVAALLEPLLRESELTRFADTLERVRGDELPSWRLALQYAAALEAALQPERSERARARARDLAELD
ncbi:MAG: hypothetical protein DRQ55_08700 [Planctomycetota bacterium]|nr:MAG: hypothetical protein DRQ55_08700 [Planctomycetota bacterium]